MPFGRKRVGGYGTGRQRKFASLQLEGDAKASRVEFANEPAATTSSSSTITVHGASENGTQCKFNSDISYGVLSKHRLCGITITKRFDADLVHAVDVRGCVDIQAQGPSRHIRSRVVTMVYYITTICPGNYRIHSLYTHTRAGVCV